MRLAAALVIALGLGACSSFNMAPKCDEATDALARLLATDGNEAPNWGRLRSIANFTNIMEVNSAYNVRECKADVSGENVFATVHYRVRQSEGVKYWFDIEVLNSNDPSVGILAQVLHDQYAS